MPGKSSKIQCNQIGKAYRALDGKIYSYLIGSLLTDAWKEKRMDTYQKSEVDQNMKEKLIRFMQGRYGTIPFPNSCWSADWSSFYSRHFHPAIRCGWSGMWSDGHWSFTAIIGCFRGMWRNAMRRIRHFLRGHIRYAVFSNSSWNWWNKDGSTIFILAPDAGRRSGSRGEKERSKSGVRNVESPLWKRVDNSEEIR